MWFILTSLSKYLEVTEFEDWCNFFQFPFDTMLWSSTPTTSLPAVMWVRSSSVKSTHSKEVKTEAELWLNKLYRLFHMKRSCVSPMSARIMYNTEIPTSQIFPGQVSTPKTLTETWDEAYTQGQDVPRQNIWLPSCARTHTDGYKIVWWENWKFNFQPYKFLKPACYATAQLLGPAPNRGDKNTLLGRKQRMGLHGIIKNCSLATLNRILSG